MLLEEIEGVVGSDAEEIKEEDLQRMSYFEAVMLEGLRRHPPAHFLVPHTVTEDVTLMGRQLMLRSWGWDGMGGADEIYYNNLI